MASLELNEELYTQLEHIVSESQEFSSVQAYAEYILKQVVEKKSKSQTAAVTQDAKYSKDDEDKIRDRLKNLGYLD